MHPNRAEQAVCRHAVGSDDSTAAAADLHKAVQHTQTSWSSQHCLVVQCVLYTNEGNEKLESDHSVATLMCLVILPVITDIAELSYLFRCLGLIGRHGACISWTNTSECHDKSTQGYTTTALVWPLQLQAKYIHMFLADTTVFCND